MEPAAGRFVHHDRLRLRERLVKPVLYVGLKFFKIFRLNLGICLWLTCLSTP